MPAACGRIVAKHDWAQEPGGDPLPPPPGPMYTAPCRVSGVCIWEDDCGDRTAAVRPLRRLVVWYKSRYQCGYFPPMGPAVPHCRAAATSPASGPTSHLPPDPLKSVVGQVRSWHGRTSLERPPRVRFGQIAVAKTARVN